MSKTVEIEGIETLDSFLKNHSKELDKTVLDSLVKGSREVRNDVVSRMPANLKKFESIFGTKKLPKAAIPSVLVGFFGRKMNYINKRGVKWDAFMLVYWQNYGTMANRDSSHDFQSARRTISRNKKGGIKPLNFWDNGVNTSYETALDKSAEDVEKTIDQLSVKYGFQ